MSSGGTSHVEAVVKGGFAFALVDGAELAQELIACGRAERERRADWAGLRVELTASRIETPDCMFQQLAELCRGCRGWCWYGYGWIARARNPNQIRLGSARLSTARSDRL
jgi:hypothetical protein